MKPTLAGLACLLTLTASPAWAEQGEELILDPENPAVQVPDPDTAQESEERQEESDESSEETETTEDSGEESIFDPENPAVFEEISDPENPAIQTGGFDYEEPEDTTGFETASFVASYATESRVDLGFSSDEDIFEQLNQLGLRLEYEPDSSLSVAIEGSFEHWWSFEEGFEQGVAAYDARLLDAYLVWRDGSFSLSVGNQVTTWGSTDLIRPGDVVNPVDLTDISASGSLQKIPQFMVDATYAGDGWAVQGLIVPFFTPNRIWVYGRDTAPLNSAAGTQLQTTLLDLTSSLIDRSRVEDVQPLLLATSEPDEGPQSFSAGVRGTLTAANTDMGLGYFFGWDRTPYLDLDDDLRAFLEIVASDDQFREDFDILGLASRNPDVIPRLQSIQTRAAAGEEIFSSRYLRQHTIQADAARFFGPIGVRADAVFQHSRTFVTSELRSVARPTFSGALGLSYERLVDENDSLVLTLEGFAIHALDADASLTQSLIPAERRGDAETELLVFDDTTFGVATAVAWSIPGSDLRLQIGGVSLIESRDIFVGGSLSRQWESWLTTSLTTLVFEKFGDDDELSIGSIYDRNDYVGVKLSGVF